MSMGTENFDNIKNEIIDKFKIIGCQKTPYPLATQVGAYDYKLPFEVNHKQEMVLVSSPMKRKQVNKYLGYLREYFEIEYREDKGDRTENGMTVFDSAIPDNYELLKVIPIIDINLFKGKDITFGLVFRPTIKEIINEK